VEKRILVGRPQSTETAAYYFTYIDKAPGDDPMAIMESQLDDALKQFANITEEKSLHRYAPEKWSIRQLLNHVTDTERAFAFRALWFARGFSSPLEGFDQDIAARGADADRVSWNDHVEDFRRVRLATLSLYGGLALDAWQRAGVASGNHVTVRALAFIIPGHVAHHLGVLRDRYL
jgi:hypothetical protein